MPGPSTAVPLPDIRNRIYKEWALKGQLNYTANDIFAQCDMDFANGTFMKIPRGAYMKEPDLARAPGGDYAQVNFNFVPLTYGTKEKGLKVPVDQNLANQVKLYFNAQVAAGDISLVTGISEHERTAAALAYNTAIVTQTAAAAHAWSSHSTATPIEDVKIGRYAVRAGCGVMPNVLHLSVDAWDDLILCDEIKDRLAFGGSASDAGNVRVANETTLAKILQVDKIVVARAIRNANQEGTTISLASVWDKTKALLAYVNPSPADFELTFGACFHWPGDGSEFAWRMESYWDEDKRSTVVRARRQATPAIVNPECGYVLTGVLS